MFEKFTPLLRVYFKKLAGQQVDEDRGSTNSDSGGTFYFNYNEVAGPVNAKAELSK